MVFEIEQILVRQRSRTKINRENAHAVVIKRVFVTSGLVRGDAHAVVITRVFVTSGLVRGDAHAEQ